MTAFSKVHVNSLLEPLGWEIPKGVRYKGMRKNQTLQCTKCNWLTERRLDNVIYRGSTCPTCGEEQQVNNSEWFDFQEKVMEKLDTLINLFTSSPKPSSTSGSQVETLFRKCISKTIQKEYGKRMGIAEWYTTSHQIADELISAIAPTVTTYNTWERLYVDLMEEFPTKQGHEIITMVVPSEYFDQMSDILSTKIVQL